MSFPDAFSQMVDAAGSGLGLDPQELLMLAETGTFPKRPDPVDFMQEQGTEQNIYNFVMEATNDPSMAMEAAFTDASANMASSLENEMIAQLTSEDAKIDQAAQFVGAAGLDDDMKKILLTEIADSTGVPAKKLDEKISAIQEEQKPSDPLEPFLRDTGIPEDQLITAGIPVVPPDASVDAANTLYKSVDDANQQDWTDIFDPGRKHRDQTAAAAAEQDAFDAMTAQGDTVITEEGDWIPIQDIYRMIQSGELKLEKDPYGRDMYTGRIVQGTDPNETIEKATATGGSELDSSLTDPYREAWVVSDMKKVTIPLSRLVDQQNKKITGGFKNPGTAAIRQQFASQDQPPVDLPLSAPVIPANPGEENQLATTGTIGTPSIDTSAFQEVQAFNALISGLREEYSDPYSTKDFKGSPERMKRYYAQEIRNILLDPSFDALKNTEEFRSMSHFSDYFAGGRNPSADEVTSRILSFWEESGGYAGNYHGNRVAEVKESEKAIQNITQDTRTKIQDTLTDQNKKVEQTLDNLDKDALMGEAGTTTPTGMMPVATGYLPGSDPHLRQLSGNPQRQWELLRAREMGEDVYNPVRYATRMQGFTPAFGKFLLSGEQSFLDYLANEQQAPRDVAADWERALGASRVEPLFAAGGAPDLDAGQSFMLQQYMNDPRALEHMAFAGLGGGQGYGADALMRAIQRDRELYATQQAAQGLPSTQYLSYLSGRM